MIQARNPDFTLDLIQTPDDDQTAFLMMTNASGNGGSFNRIILGHGRSGL